MYIKITKREKEMWIIHDKRVENREE